MFQKNSDSVSPSQRLILSTSTAHDLTVLIIVRIQALRLGELHLKSTLATGEREGEERTDGELG